MILVIRRPSTLNRRHTSQPTTTVRVLSCVDCCLSLSCYSHVSSFALGYIYRCTRIIGGRASGCRLSQNFGREGTRLLELWGRFNLRIETFSIGFYEVEFLLLTTDKLKIASKTKLAGLCLKPHWKHLCRSHIVGLLDCRGAGMRKEGNKGGEWLEINLEELDCHSLWGRLTQIVYFHSV